MKYIDCLITYLDKENYYAKVSALFRVSLCFVLLFDLVVHYDSIRVFYSFDSWFVVQETSSFLNFIRENYIIFFLLYSATLIMYLLGIGKNIIAFLFLILFVIKYYMTIEVVNWGDEILMLVLFYMVFIDSYQYLTVLSSNFSKKLIYPNQNLISNMAVYLIILNVCLIYLDNGIYKILGRDWLNGQAFYFAINNFQLDGTSINRILSDNIYISILASYIVLMSQLLFLPLIFYKKTKKGITIITLLFHIGLAVMFYMYKFQLVMMLMHLFFFTDKELMKVKFIPKRLHLN